MNSNCHGTGKFDRVIRVLELNGFELSRYMYIFWSYRDFLNNMNSIRKHMYHRSNRKGGQSR